MTVEEDTTSDEADIARPKVSRSGEPWTASEHEQVAWCLRHRQSLDEIADLIGRSPTAVSTRCRMMLPPKGRASGPVAVEQLRELLISNPDYDWQAEFRADARRRGTFYWDSNAEHTLRDGWERARPMLALAAETGASEHDIVSHLRAMQLAETRRQIADQVGYVPNGALATWLIMAEDLRAAAVWILDVTGLQHRYDPHHLSIHANKADATQELDRLLEAHCHNGGDPTDVQATIVARTVGEGDVDSDGD